MAVLTIEATIENGQIRLPDDVSLPSAGKVHVVFPEAEGPSSIHLRSPRLAEPEHAADFEKMVIELSSDDAV